MDFGGRHQARRGNAVRAFAAAAGTYPWYWSAPMLGDGYPIRRIKVSTVRGYQDVRLFFRFVADPAYGWPKQCEARFGAYPIQIVHEWNTAAHGQENESDPRKRAFSRGELEEFFGY